MGNHNTIIKIIRLLQNDVYRDKYDWLKELLENIELLRTKSTDKKIIYMCKNNEYQKNTTTNFIKNN